MTISLTLRAHGPPVRDPGPANAAAAVLLRLWMRVAHRLEVLGRERLPARGPYVLTANHVSHLDAPSLLAALPWAAHRRACSVAAEEYFFQTWPRFLAARWFANAVPIRRTGGAEECLARLRAVLAGPDSVLIYFPEGTRSLTGRPARFRRGIGRLLAGTAVPAVPCFIEGTYESWPKGRVGPIPWPIRVTFGRPRVYDGVRAEEEGFLQVARDIERAVAEVSRGNA